jgi:hypothetical protein
MQQIEIENVGTEARETGLTSTRHPISRYFVGFHFGDEEHTVALSRNGVTNQLLGAPVAVIPRCINQTHPERYACAQRFFLSRFGMSSLPQTCRALTNRRDNHAAPELHCARRSVRSENRCDVAPNREPQTDRGAKCVKVTPAELTLVHLLLSSGVGKLKRLTFLGEPTPKPRKARKSRTQCF